MHHDSTLNLILDPWLPVRRRSGRTETIAPWAVNDRIDTDPVTSFAWPRPELNAASLELLVGMLATGLPRAGDPDAAWQWGWSEPPGPDVLGARLERLAPFFELVTDGAPAFLQHLDPLAEAGVSNPARLLFDTPGALTAKLNTDLFRRRAAFAEHLAGHMAERTQRLGRLIVERLAGQGVEPDRAMDIARQVAGAVARINPETDQNPDFTRQLVMLAPAEKQRAFELADRWAQGASPGKLTAADVANAPESAADIAMFGRMLADAASQNVDAAVQVSHALTTHRAVPEDDYYTAVEDRKPDEEDAGARSSSPPASSTCTCASIWTCCPATSAATRRCGAPRSPPWSPPRRPSRRAGSRTPSPAAPARSTCSPSAASSNRAASPGRS